MPCGPHCFRGFRKPVDQGQVIRFGFFAQAEVIKSAGAEGKWRVGVREIWETLQKAIDRGDGLQQALAVFCFVGAAVAMR